MTNRTIDPVSDQTTPRLADTTPQNAAVRSVVIVGGGTAGWMTAAALAKFLPSTCRITLVESEQIGTVGVGEATVPHLRYFNELLGIDEQQFIQATQATYKLGIRFKDWGYEGADYFHPFSRFGQPLTTGIAFHQAWMAANQKGMSASFDEFCLAAVAAKQGRFDYPAATANEQNTRFGYAFHMDATRYAQLLRAYSEKAGVRRVEGQIATVAQGSQGEIVSLALETGETIGGDFFVDCSGFAALLLRKTLAVDYEDWSHWLKCNAAVAVPSRGGNDIPSYTLSQATRAGWRWQIPLQHRDGNGVVFCKDAMSVDEATTTLLREVRGEALAEPRQLNFTSGRSCKSWEKNCVAIGLSSGFLEPLESTSIYLIQVAIMKLLEVFPSEKIDITSASYFNRCIALEYERIRDFLILHYCIGSPKAADANTCDNQANAFWQACREMPLPESLTRKIGLFKQQGHVEQYQQGMFLEPSWLAVYFGQGLIPDAVSPRLAGLGDAELRQMLDVMRTNFANKASAMPLHAEFLARQRVATGGVDWPSASMSLYGVFS